MTIKKAIGIGLLGASIIGLIAVGIKFNFFNKQNIKTLQAHADEIPNSYKWVLNKELNLPSTTTTWTSVSNFKTLSGNNEPTYGAVKLTSSTLAYGSLYYGDWRYETIYNTTYNGWHTNSADTNTYRAITFTSSYPTGNFAGWLVNNATPIYEKDVCITSGQTAKPYINNEYIGDTYILNNSTTIQVQIDIGITALYINKTSYNPSSELPNEIIINDQNVVINSYGNPSGTITKTINIIYNQGAYTITPTFTNITSSNTNYNIAPNGTWTTTLTAESGYSLPKTINVTGATANYNRQTGVLTLSNPTGNVTLTATAVTGNVYETEIIDIRGLMLQILTMPFTFISQAFDVTLWPNTDYEFNIGNFIIAIISIASILFIIRLFTSGFSIIGNYTNSRIDGKLKKSQIKYNEAKTNLANRTDPNHKSSTKTSTNINHNYNHKE